MRSPSYTKQFERDLRRMIKQKKDIQKIKAVMASLIDGAWHQNSTIVRVDLKLQAHQI